MPSGNLPDGMAVNFEMQQAPHLTTLPSISFGRLPNETGESPVPPLPENVNYAVKSSFLLSFLESVPEVSAKLKKMAALSRGAATERKFEDVVKSAEQAAVLVLVY